MTTVEQVSVLLMLDCQTCKKETNYREVKIFKKDNIKYFQQAINEIYVLHKRLLNC